MARAVDEQKVSLTQSGKCLHIIKTVGEPVSVQRMKGQRRRRSPSTKKPSKALVVVKHCLKTTRYTFPVAWKDYKLVYGDAVAALQGVVLRNMIRRTNK